MWVNWSRQVKLNYTYWRYQTLKGQHFTNSTYPTLDICRFIFSKIYQTLLFKYHLFYFLFCIIFIITWKIYEINIDTLTFDKITNARWSSKTKCTHEKALKTECVSRVCAALRARRRRSALTRPNGSSLLLLPANGGVIVIQPYEA